MAVVKQSQVPASLSPGKGHVVQKTGWARGPVRRRDANLRLPTFQAEASHYNGYPTLAHRK